MASSDKTYDELVKLLRAWTQAIASNNAGAIGQFMSDDWVIVGETGVTERGDFLGAIETGDLTHEAMEINVRRVRVYENLAVVTGRGTNSGTFKGEPFSADEWSTDVFVKKDGLWRCVLTHLTPVQNREEKNL
ncbi:MAG: nuclear transport factor 2 family protein [Bacteroidota bacterium]